MSAAAELAIRLAERGAAPDALIRHGIRRLVRERLRELATGDCEHVAASQQRFVAMMNGAPIAPVPELANEQHYEVPAEFFRYVLGRHRKYSCCHWSPEARTLDAAEAAALVATAQRAEIEDGMRVLELGCGWGSLSLWLAASFPRAAITAVSNSRSQREYIVAEAQRRELQNLRVITADANSFAIDERFDRVVSVEMFEHMRNYAALFERIAGWLQPNGAFFMHIFAHRSAPYEFVDQGPGDWMGRHFFSGGIMPSDDLPLHFQRDLVLAQRWRWSGTHYQKTADAWLDNIDRNREAVMPILAATYGERDAEVWRMRWRMFFMACAELFGFANGQEWGVSHYLFRKPAPR
jgi:cyclopropane-fatty-acyl-phospholipid synthase